MAVDVALHRGARGGAGEADLFEHPLDVCRELEADAVFKRNALEDPDFDAIRDDPEFSAITGQTDATRAST